MSYGLDVLPDPLDVLPDPLAALPDVFGGGEENIDPELQLRMLQAEFEDEEKGNRLIRGIKNFPKDIKETVWGFGKMFGGGLNLASDIVGGIVDSIQGDEASLEERRSRQNANYLLLKEGIKSEIQRVKNVYGSALQGDLDPLFDQFAEQPFGTTMDIGGIVDLAAAPLRVGAGLARRSANKLIAKGAVEDIDELSRLTGMSEKASRHALAEHAKDPDYFDTLLARATAARVKTSPTEILVSTKTTKYRDVPVKAPEMKPYREKELYELSREEFDNVVGIDPAEIDELIPQIQKGVGGAAKGELVDTGIPVKNVLKNVDRQGASAYGNRLLLAKFDDLDLSGPSIKVKGGAKLYDVESPSPGLDEFGRQRPTSTYAQVVSRAILEGKSVPRDVMRQAGIKIDEAAEVSKTGSKIVDETRPLFQEIFKPKTPKGSLRSVAVKLKNGEVVEGGLGTHAELVEELRTSKKYGSVGMESPGYVDASGRYIDVFEAEKRFGKGDSTQLLNKGILKSKFKKKPYEVIEQELVPGPDDVQIRETPALRKYRQIKQSVDKVQESSAVAQAMAATEPTRQLGTKLSVAADRVSSLSPFRLFTQTIGAMPGVKNLKSMFDYNVKYMDLASQISRQGGVTLDEMVQSIRASGKYAKVEDVIAVRDVMQGFKRAEDLTEVQRELYANRMKVGNWGWNIAKAHEPEKWTLEKRAELLKSAALSNEHNLYLEEARKVVRAGPEKFAEKVKKNEVRIDELQAQLEKKVVGSKKYEETLKKIDTFTARRDAAFRTQQALEILDEKMAAGELGFVPGFRTSGPMEKVSMPGVRDDVKFLADLHGVDTPSSKHFLRKEAVTANPLIMEAAYTEYAMNMAQFFTRRTLLQASKENGFIVPLNTEGLKTKLKGSAILSQAGPPPKGFSPIELDGQVYLAPTGIHRLLSGLINPKPLFSNKFAQQGVHALVDTPTTVFRRMVLGYSPRWVTFNTLGNHFLFTLAAGNYATLAKMVPYKISDSLEKYLKNVPVIGKVVSDLAKEWRELVPRSVAKGLIQVEGNLKNLHNPYPEFYAGSENSWMRWGVKKWEETEARIRMASPTVGGGVIDLLKGNQAAKINEFVEELYRGALWIDKGRRELRRMDFSSLGDRLYTFAGESFKTQIAKLAEELGPLRIKPGQAGFPVPKLSPQASNTLGEVNTWMNDYYRLGPNERAILRRVFPFYSWMKFVNRLATELPYHHPIRMSAAAHMSNVMNDTFSVGDYVPEWLQNRFPVKENEDGTVTFQSGTGANIFEGVVLGHEGLKDLWNGVNPVLLVPWEWTFGFDAFRGEKNRVSPDRAVQGGEGIFGLERSQKGTVSSFRSGHIYKLDESGNIQEVVARPSLALTVARSGYVPFFPQVEKVLRGGAHDDIGTIGELMVELGRVLNDEPRVYPGAFTDPKTGALRAPAKGDEQALAASGFSKQDYNVEALRQNEIEGALSALKRIKKERGKLRLSQGY